MDLSDILTVIVVFFGSILVSWISGKRKGRSEGATEREEAAIKRQEVRDEIDLDVGTGGGAADRLHADWRRDD
jgi:hypothetical protein